LEKKGGHPAESVGKEKETGEKNFLAGKEKKKGIPIGTPKERECGELLCA